MHKPAKTAAAWAIFEQIQQRPPAQSNAWTPEHVLKLLYDKGDKQNVPCSLALYLHTALIQQLALMGYTDTAVTMTVLGREALAYDLRHLDMPTRNALL